MSITPRPEPPAPPRRPRRHAGRVALIVVFWGLVAAIAFIGALAWYATTPSFENRVRHAVIAELEKTTGGRVTLQRFSWQLSHLAFEADDLTIHGLEAPGEVPYAHFDRLYVRLQILSFFRPKISLNYLEADHPVVHLIVYPDGSTNAPRPKHPSSKSTTNEIFDLAIGRTVVDNGLAIVNERSIPFSLTASNLGAQVSYVPSDGHYVGNLHAEDVVAQRGVDPPVHSQLDASLDVGRNTAKLISLTLQSGPTSRRQKTVIRLNGTLSDFADPRWVFAVQGAIDTSEVRALTGVPGLEAGVAQLSAAGHGTREQFTIDGSAGITGGAFREGTVNIAGVSAHSIVHITQDLIAVTGVHATVATGGSLNGALTIANWQTPVSGAATAASEKGTIRTRIAGFSLDSILDMVAPRHYRRLGFDTAASGTANVDWTGGATSLVGTVQVALAPTHAPAPGEVPVTGVVDAKYVHRTGTVSVEDLDVHTPASQIRVAGTLGVYPLTGRSEITGSLVTTNLAEFNPILATFGISAEGRPSPIPAQLNGQAQFHGMVTGSLDSPDFRGHLEATEFTVVPNSSAPSAEQPLGNVHFDSLTADADYSSGSLSVSAATLVQGQTTIRFHGEVHGDPEKPEELFAGTSTIRGGVEVENADLAQWTALTGKSSPVSGVLNLHAETAGTIGDLRGSGQVSLTHGAIDDEPFRSLTADLEVQGKDIAASHLVFTLDGGRVTGSGGYNFADRTVQFDLQGSGFQLAHIRRIQNEQYPVSGLVVFSAHGSGPLRSPSLQASFHVRNLSLAHQFSGFVDAAAHTQGGALDLHLTAHLDASTLDLSSETQLSGDYLTHASLNVAKFNIDPLLRTFSLTGIRGSSDIDAAITVSGPLRHPKQLSGDARASELAITLEDVPIHSDGTLHGTLSNGTLRLDPVHIVGTDTDLKAQGSLGVFANPRPLHASASGSINMSLAESLDTDIISSGHVDFSVTAQGTTQAPDLNGQVKFTNVNLALEDYTNGLSRMNGTLVFDQDRLDFRDVTAYSGGGLIKVGGFATYHHGLYADLTATANQVRIRYPEGITSTANASLRFQGTRASMVLSGRVLLTGFSVSPNLDVAALAASTSGVSLPPNPESPSNRVRLDVRISSAPSLNFQNSFARLAGNVDLSIRGTLAQPTVLGRVTITEGAASFNGDKFELQHGEIYFSNPVRIQPVVDITATTRVEDYNITIGLQGSTSNLNPTFRSEPPLSEQDIFSLLAMGRTQEEQQVYENEENQAGVNSTADALLGGALNATISSRIQKLFGGGSVRIDPTFISGVGNATARITVTEPISKQATLTYATNVNSTAEQLIQGEWRLTQDFSILAVRDESGVFSLIFRLHRRYH